MDELLYKFYTKQVYIDATNATDHELRTLAEIVGLKWASGKELYEWRPNYHQYCFLCCSNELFKDSVGQCRTASQIYNEIKCYKNYIVFTDMTVGINSLYSIQAFINHFTKPLKEVTEEEIEVIWG